MKLSGKRGLTLIETMATATIVAFVTLAVINLLSFVYKGIVSTQLKTISYENVSDNIDKYKKKGFAALRNNPASLMTYAAIKAAGPSDYYEEVTLGNTVYEIYRIIQYAQENESGDLVAIPPSNVTTDIKMITVHIIYLDRGNNAVKSTERIAYVSNREVPSVGSSIEGALSAASGPALTLAKSPLVYVTGHPELTASGYLSGAVVMYKIKNLQPGKYSLWAEATGYYPTTFTANPINVTNTVQAITGKNIALVPADTGTLTGIVCCADKVTLEASGDWLGAVPPNSLWSHTEVPTGDAQIKIQNIIGLSDAKNVFTSDHTSANILYTDFAYADVADRGLGQMILEVLLHVNYNATSALGTDKLRIYINRNPSAANNWSTFNVDEPNLWGIAAPNDIVSTTPFNFYGDIYLLNGSNTVPLDITGLFNEAAPWTWTMINNLALAFRAIGTGFNPVRIDSVWLEVYYNQNPVRPPCQTNGATVYANDGLSSETGVDSQGRYTMNNVYTTTTWNMFNFSSTKSNFSSPPYIGLKAVRLDKNTTKTVNMPLYPADPGNGMITGKVVDSTTNLGIAGVTVIITLDAAAPNVTQTTAADGTYTLSPVTMGSGSLRAAKTNYIQTSNNQPIVSYITSNQIITMKPTGLISGRVTNNTTSAGIDNIQLVAKNSAGGGDTKAVTVGGGYYSLTVTAGDTYSVETILDGTQYRCVYPATMGNKCININIGAGTSVTNQNLRLDYNQQPISGSLSISNPTGVNTTITNGALIIAQPVGNTILAQGDAGAYFSSLSDGDEQNTYYRTIWPSFTTYTKQDGTYSVMVPVYGGNYDVYAYYTYTSISTSNVINSKVYPFKYQKFRTNYYKKIAATAPGSAGVNFTGSWTAYP